MERILKLLFIFVIFVFGGLNGVFAQESLNLSTLITAQNIKFENCNLKYVNFSGAKINKMLIEETNLCDSTFLENKIKDLELIKVNLDKTEFIKTSLQKIDFSNCDISRTIFDLNSLKGIILDSYQIPSLAYLLGVEIKK